MKKLIAFVVPILLLLSSCALLTKKPSYEIYQIYDDQINFTLKYNHRSELKDEIKIVKSDRAPQTRSITISGITYNLSYIESEARTLTDYKTDKYEVLNVDALFKGIIPTIRFYSGTDKVAGIFGFVNSSIGEINAFTDEDLEKSITEYLQSFVDLTDYDDCAFEKPTDEKDLYKLTWKCRKGEFELNDYIEVVVRNNGDIISTRIEGEGAFNEADLERLKIDEELCTRLISDKLVSIYGTSMNQYKVSKKTLYKTQGGRFGIYYNVEVAISSDDKKECCELFIYTDKSL